MIIGFVGGVERAEPHYARVAQAYGHDVLFHDGKMRDRGGTALGGMLDRCDLVIVVTDVNSHGAVQFARRHLRGRGKSPILVRRLGLTRFADLLASLDGHAASGEASARAAISAS